MFLIAETFLSTGVLDSFYWPPNDSGRPYIIIFLPIFFLSSFLSHASYIQRSPHIGGNEPDLQTHVQNLEVPGT